MTEREDRISGYQGIRRSEGKKMDGGRGTREGRREKEEGKREKTDEGGQKMGDGREGRQDIRTSGKQGIRKKEGRRQRTEKRY
jgi:hypothetical protein